MYYYFTLQFLYEHVKCDQYLILGFDHEVKLFGIQQNIIYSSNYRLTASSSFSVCKLFYILPLFIWIYCVSAVVLASFLIPQKYTSQTKEAIQFRDLYQIMIEFASLKYKISIS